PLNYILAALFGIVPFAMSLAIEKRAYDVTIGDFELARPLLVLSVLCGVFVGVADYSSAVAMRDIVAAHLGDQNRVTNDKVGEVKRIEKRIAEIKSGWKTNYLSPDAYQAELDNLQGDFLFKRSKQCGDTSLPDSRAHCAKIASAKAHKSMAEQRQKEDKEAYELGIQLASAKEASAGVTTHANPTEAATKAFVSWGRLTLVPNATEMAWGQNAILLFMTGLVVSLISIVSHIIGVERGREHLRINGRQEHFTFTAPQVEGPPAAREPIPLRVLEPGRNTVIINGQEQPNSTQTDALIARAMQALEKYEQSPFAQGSGKA
ncbi:MAG: hypothetical protein ABL897_08475, partial [Hyphomicrobium sp.]